NGWELSIARGKRHPAFHLEIQSCRTTRAISLDDDVVERRAAGGALQSYTDDCANACAPSRRPREQRGQVVCADVVFKDGSGTPRGQGTSGHRSFPTFSPQKSLLKQPKFFHLQNEHLLACEPTV